MNVIDKLLLGVLVALLPIGIVVATIVGGEDPTSTQSSQTTIDEEKLKQVITQTVQQSQPTVVPPKTIKLGSVVYASESGKLKISGTAPAANSTVLMTAVVLPTPTNSVAPTPNSTTSAKPSASPQVFGTNVETLSILPKPGGVFEFEYEIEKQFLNNIIELRFEQNESVNTVRFDLAKKIQVL